MDFLLDALDEIAAGVFVSVAHLLNLTCDVVFVDTTSHVLGDRGADELAEPGRGRPTTAMSRPGRGAGRTLGHSKDHRDDLPQVVIAMAVTRDGIPVRCWTFPGNTADTAIIRTVKDDLADVEPAPAGLGRRPRVRLGGEPGLPDPRRRALHPRREAAPHQRRGRRGAGPAGPLPHRRREPAGQGGPGRPGGRRRRRGARRAVRRLPQPRARRPRRRRARAADRPPGAADRRLGRLDRPAPRRARRRR